MRLWTVCSKWFGNLPLKTKLLISFGWLCLFTVVLAAVCLGEIYQIREQTALEIAHRPDRGTAVAEIALKHNNGLPNHALELRQSVLRITDRLQAVVFSLLCLILLLDFVMAWRLTQIITRPILEACAILDHLSQHDLTVPPTVESAGEVGWMGAALNRTILHLHGVLVGLRDSAEALTALARKLSDETAHPSDNCQARKDLTQKVLSSTYFLTEKGGEIVRSSSEATSASHQSATSAEECGCTMVGAPRSMSEVATSSSTIYQLMQRLNARSQEIGKAVKVIREISKKTNLLALNAAIEAARAGEQGRGFAVVAEEVRRLAEHTRSATVEIAQMVASIRQETAGTAAAVKASRSSIENGRARTGDVSKMLARIIHRECRTESLSHKIVSAGEAQFPASRKIGVNAAHVAKLAAASYDASTQIAETGAHIRTSAEHLAWVLLEFRFSASQLSHRNGTTTEAQSKSMGLLRLPPNWQPLPG